MVGLWLKLQMEMVDSNDFIFTSFQSLPIFVGILRAVMYQSEQAHSGPSQTFKINLFARIVNVFKLTLLTIFAKSTIMDVLIALTARLTCSNAGN